MPMKNKFQTLIAEGKTGALIQELLALQVPDKYLANEIIGTAGRFAELERQIRAGTISTSDANIIRNNINASLLDMVQKLPNDIVIPKNQAQNTIHQHHSGSGDNVGGDKIGKQIIMGAGSVFNEYNRSEAKNESPETKAPVPPKEEPNEQQKLPETPSGLLGIVLGWIPPPYRPIAAVVILGLAAFFAYQYYMPAKEEPKKSENTEKQTQTEKVYVSGIIHIDNGEPKPNEIKRMTLRNIDANPASFDGTGRFTFSGVKIPANKRLLVDITFFDGKTIPTQELIVDEMDQETQTVRLPDLYAERPKPATKNSPAKGWTVNIVHNGVGDNNVQINK